MIQTKFEVCNFRGIRNMNLVVPSEASAITLIGLNETGKTTVLNALNFISYTLENTTDLTTSSSGKIEIHKLIPISERHDFNGAISVKVTFELDEMDVAAIKRKADSLHYKSVSIGQVLTIEEKYEFKNSELIGSGKKNAWSISMTGKKGRSKTVKSIANADWQELINVLKARLPRVIFFKNFYLNFPMQYI